MPNEYSKNIVYLSKAQYQELITNNSITVNGQTITYSDSDIYVTPQAEPVTDVQINGSSVVQNGVANIPKANGDTPGVVSTNTSYGLSSNGSSIWVVGASTFDSKTGTNAYKPIVPKYQKDAVFYGLATAAGDSTQSASSNAVGTYTDDAKQKIQNMLGVTDLISTEEVGTATAAHAINSLFLMGGKLYKATAAIAIGDAVVEGTNCEVVKADEVFVKNTDYATGSNAGVVKVSSGRGIEMNSANQLQLIGADNAAIKAETDSRKPITPLFQHSAVFYGLSKVAGVDLANEAVTLGTYPETSKTAIRSLIGAAAASDIPSVPVQDVQVNGTSVLSNGIANVPVASYSNYGTVKTNSAYGTAMQDGYVQVYCGLDADIKTGTSVYKPVSPARQHQAAFYGLAKAAGDITQAASSNAVGTYTESAKASIRMMLGAASTNIVAVQDEQPTDTDTKVWLPGTQATGIEVPTYAEFQQGLAGKVSDVQTNGTSIVSNGIANIPVASANTLGVVKADADYGTEIANQRIKIVKAADDQVKQGTHASRPITPFSQHIAAFYGLAKAAGDTTQSASDNAVGTYTADASAAIRSMLGAVGDVQVDSTSVVTNGIATIPKATTSQFGVVKIRNTYGIQIDSVDNCLSIQGITDAQIKAGTNIYNPVMAAKIHTATFYGLAKAAGDTTQSASSNAVGSYTTEAKSAIQSMLGIDLASIASEVEIPLVETVSGTTPSITGQPNTRYVCGEVSTLSITPPSAGSIDVIFDSGSTAAVLTVPNTVRWPAWFDATALEADTTYEILITDGVYGSVMTWAN